MILVDPVYGQISQRCAIVGCRQHLGLDPPRLAGGGGQRDACDGCDAFSNCTLYLKKTYSIHSTRHYDPKLYVFPTLRAVRKRVTSVKPVTNPTLASPL